MSTRVVLFLPYTFVEDFLSERRTSYQNYLRAETTARKKIFKE
jgi:hypothetical protein